MVAFASQYDEIPSYVQVKHERKQIMYVTVIDLGHDKYEIICNNRSTLVDGDTLTNYLNSLDPSVRVEYTDSDSLAAL